MPNTLPTVSLRRPRSWPSGTYIHMHSYIDQCMVCMYVFSHHSARLFSRRSRPTEREERRRRRKGGDPGHQNNIDNSNESDSHKPQKHKAERDECKRQGRWRRSINSASLPRGGLAAERNSAAHHPEREGAEGEGRAREGASGRPLSRRNAASSSLLVVGSMHFLLFANVLFCFALLFGGDGFCTTCTAQNSPQSINPLGQTKAAQEEWGRTGRRGLCDM